MKIFLAILFTSIYVWSAPLNVCYDRKFVSQATGKWVYVGCKRYYDSCHSNHKLHFGKYPSDKSARNALYRCNMSLPKFVNSGRKELLPPSPSPRVTPPRTYNKPKAQIKQPTTGSGFYINPKYVLTNQHVVASCRKIILSKDGITSNAILRYTDSNNDLALLETDMTNASYLKFRPGRGLRIGESIIALGYPLGILLGNRVKLTTGNVSSTTGLMNDTTKIQLTAPIQPGSSGGPLLDNAGDVVGIIYAKVKKNIADNVSLAIKANVIQMFLDVHEVEYFLDENRTKKEVVDIAQDAKKAVVQIICR